MKRAATLEDFLGLWQGFIDPPDHRPQFREDLRTLMESAAETAVDEFRQDYVTKHSEKLERLAKKIDELIRIQRKGGKK